jgi:GNAT superfamily N-acetyltransferase
MGKDDSRAEQSNHILEFSQIKDVNDRDFKEAMRIYTESFPPNERQPINIIGKRLNQNLYKIFVGLLGKRAVFMALLYPLKNTDFILFDYMATDKNFRNKGIGSKFLKYLLGVLKKYTPDKYLILEVEDPKYGNNKEQRKRRVNFYKRLGAKEMKNVSYILPPLSGNIPTEMILMVFPEYKEQKVDGDMVKKLITKIYKELYNRDEDDSLLNSFIHEMNNSIELI